MTNIKHILISLIVFAAPSLGAETITSTPGSLSRQPGVRGATSLTVTGEIDIRDMQFIVDSLPGLTTLDLGSARIAEYSGSRRVAPASADVIPAYGLMGLQAGKVILPATLKEIGEGAFASSALTELTVPDGVSAIGPAAFAGCSQLGTINLPAALKSIAPLTFKDCKLLKTIDLPATVTAIDSCAFAGCTGLSDVAFPASLARIGARAFEGTALTDLSLEGCKSLRTVGSFAFAYIPTLTAAILPPTATQLGEGLFFDCEALEAVAMPRGIDELPAYVLKGTSLADASGALPEGVTRIGRYALYGNARIATLRLPEGLESIGDRALAGLSSLQTLDAALLSELPELGEDVFAGTASKSVTLLADSDMVPVFEVAPQWKEFNVTDYSSTDETVADASMSRLLLRYDGTAIHITAAEPISAVEVYDLEGRLSAARQVSPPEPETSVGVSGYDNQIVILRVTYASGDRTSIAKLKL